MFTSASKDGYKKMLEGISMKTLVHGEKTHMVEFFVKKGCTVPLHSHPNEQSGYLVSGQIRFTGEQEILCNPGDSWCFAADIEHGATALEDSVIIEVFSPPREDYL